MMETTPKWYLLCKRRGHALFQKALLEGLNQVHPHQALPRPLPAANGSRSGPTQVPHREHAARGNPTHDVLAIRSVPKSFALQPTPNLTSAASS